MLQLNHGMPEMPDGLHMSIFFSVTDLKIEFYVEKFITVITFCNSQTQSSFVENILTLSRVLSGRSGATARHIHDI